MSGLFGSERFVVDQKNRVSISAKLRRALPKEADETFVVMAGYDGCIALYPSHEYRRIEDKLRGLPFLTDEGVRRFERSYTSAMTDVQLDTQGRVMLPANLMQQAGLGKQVLVVGVVDHIEVWDPDRFAQAVAGVDRERESKEYLK